MSNFTPQYYAMNVLIVEDEQDLADSISGYLREQQFFCEVATTQNQAVDRCIDKNYEVVILDLNLPDGNGLEFLDWLMKDQSETVVIIVSARNSLDDRLNGLDLGADDYITKPFHLAELNARINAQLRRKFKNEGDKINFEELELDVQSHVATVNGQPLDLTAREFDLFHFLMINRNKVVTKKSLASHLWKDNLNIDDNYELIYTYMKNLRKKISDLGGRDYVKSIYGVGYKFGDDNA